MPGAEISALPMGICALVVGVLKARTSFLRVRSEYANHMEGQNFFSSAACLHPASVCILCGLQYINIYPPAHSEISSFECSGSGLY